MLPLFANCTKKGDVHDHAVGQEQRADSSAGVLADSNGDIDKDQNWVGLNRAPARNFE